MGSISLKISMNLLLFANGNTIGYEYNSAGDLTKLIYPDGKIVTYDYNLDNQLTTVTDRNGRKTSYDYDKNGRLIKTQRPDGSAEVLSYDDAGQLLSIADTDKSGNLIDNYKYQYDLNGNVIEENNSGKNSSMPNAMINTGANMTYGLDNRLLTFNNVQAQYDADGNMIK